MDYIYKVLTQPDAQPPALPQTTTGKRVRDQREMHYQMLPHARPGGIAGLLELVLDHNGKDDIYRLANDLSFEIDDLLPIVDAAQLLGFLKVTEGDAEITPTGNGICQLGDPSTERAVSKRGDGERAAASPDCAGY